MQSNKKQGKIVAIPVTNPQVGQQVIWTGLIMKIINVENGDIQLNHSTGVYGFMRASELSTMVVEYIASDSPTFTNRNSIPLKYSQWSAALANGEVDSDKVVEFVIVENFYEDTSKEYEIGKGQPAIKVQYAKIIPQKDRAITISMGKVSVENIGGKFCLTLDGKKMYNEEEMKVKMWQAVVALHTQTIKKNRLIIDYRDFEVYWQQNK